MIVIHVICMYTRLSLSLSIYIHAYVCRTMCAIYHTVYDDRWRTAAWRCLLTACGRAPPRSSSGAAAPLSLRVLFVLNMIYLHTYIV